MGNFTRPGSFFTAPSATRSPYLLPVVIFTSFIGNCKAQTNDNDTSVQAVIFVVIASTMCLIFWACYACMCYSRQKCTASTTRLPTVYYSSNTHQSNSYSTNECEQPRSVQREFCQTGVTSRYCEHTRIGNHGPAIIEAVSLPEATLHEGEAPPAYEEAIRMQTVNFY